MTNAIEQAKREMCDALENMKGRITINYSVKDMIRGAQNFEDLFEHYLEQVRQDHETARKRFEDVQSLESQLDEMTHMRGVYYKLACDYTEKSVDLERRLAAMTQDRDDCQLRMHAIDHAYNEQQKKTGTCGQVCGDRGASEQADANTMAILGVIVDCQQLVSDWAVYGYRAKKQMKKMAYVLNNNPELRAALDHFEGKA